MTTPKGKPGDQLDDDAMAEYLKARADDKAATDPVDNAQANLDKMKEGPADMGRQPQGHRGIRATIRRWLF